MRKNASVRKTQGKIFQILKALLRKEIKAEFSVGKEATADSCPAKMGRVLHAPPQARETKQCEAERKGKRPTHGDKKDVAAKQMPRPRGTPNWIRTSGLPLRSTAYHFVNCSYHIFPCCFFANCAAWRQVNLHKFP